ncbi:MAG: deoxyribodipyrimidine photo-lyase, partial [Armatimonadota bacterium]
MPGDALCWIRRDLRLHDHAALSAATAHHQRVAVVFVFDALILNALEDRDDKRVTFIYESLVEIDAALRAHGSRLIVLHGDPVELIPRLALELRVDAVYANHDDEPYAIARDQRVAQALQSQVQSLNTFKDHVIFERQEVTTQSGGDFRVYTPYMRAWRARLRPADVAERSVDDKSFWLNLP